jgi:hypothetical protein
VPWAVSDHEIGPPPAALLAAWSQVRSGPPEPLSRSIWPVLAHSSPPESVFGPSPHDDASYYLIRAFGSVQDRQREEDAFYGSDERRQGPREAIVGRIESMTSVVIETDEATVDGLCDSSGDGGVARGGGPA